jgi:spermidine synthase
MGGERVARRFQELAWHQTPMGELVLRRRWDPAVREDIYEIKLNDEFLMSSLFTVAEVELARLALAEIPGPDRDVLVGGLGLGFTARAVLESADVRSLVVVEALSEVIEWHQAGLVPAGAALASDERCTLVHADFFAMLRDPTGSASAAVDRRFHAVIVDIDHSPRHLLEPGHGDFYVPAGIRRVATRLHPEGVFALWSNDPPDDEFTAVLAGRFTDVRAEVVSFANPLQGRAAANTVYLGKAAPRK